jgi:hypothetical protein
MANIRAVFIAIPLSGGRTTHEIPAPFVSGAAGVFIPGPAPTEAGSLPIVFPASLVHRGSPKSATRPPCQSSTCRDTIVRPPGGERFPRTSRFPLLRALN